MHARWCVLMNSQSWTFCSWAVSQLKPLSALAVIALLAFRTSIVWFIDGKLWSAYISFDDLWNLYLALFELWIFIFRVGYALLVVSKDLPSRIRSSACRRELEIQASSQSRGLSRINYKWMYLMLGDLVSIPTLASWYCQSPIQWLDDQSRHLYSGRIPQTYGEV